MSRKTNFQKFTRQNNFPIKKISLKKLPRKKQINTEKLLPSKKYPKKNS